MRFEFSCKRTDGGIGFEAKGYGLGYNYDGRNLTLDIIHLGLGQPLLLLDLGRVFPRNALLYAEFLEKAAQINALLYSSNQTLNLCETIHIEKLVPVISELSKTAELAHDVEIGNYPDFSNKVKKTYDLEGFKLEQLRATASEEKSYKLTMKTRNGTEIKSTNKAARTAIAKIAEKTLRDVVAAEFSIQSGQNAHTLIALAARLSTIARLLDTNFDPSDRLLISKRNNKETVAGKLV